MNSAPPLQSVSPLALPTNLSDAARDALGRAPEIATDELNHNYLGSEHILVAIVRQHGEVPMIIMVRRYSRSTDDVLKAVIDVSGRPEKGVREFDRQLDRTANFWAVVQKAEEVAAERRCKEIGLVDLLIAITRIWESRAYAVLEKLGVDPKELAGHAMGLK